MDRSQDATLFRMAWVVDSTWLALRLQV